MNTVKVVLTACFVALATLSFAQEGKKTEKPSGNERMVARSINSEASSSMLSQSKEALTSLLSTVEATLNRLTTDNDDVKKRNESMKVEVVKMKSEAARLIAENELLDRQIAQIEAKNVQLAKFDQIMVSQNRKIIGANIAKQKMNDRRVSFYTEQITDNEAVIAENESLIGQQRAIAEQINSALSAK